MVTSSYSVLENDMEPFVSPDVILMSSLSDKVVIDE